MASFQQHPDVSRRTFFSSVANGLHGAALASLVSGDLFGRGLGQAPRDASEDRPSRSFNYS